MKAGVILSKYFNTHDSPEGYEKRPVGVFAKEVKDLGPDGKVELALMAAEDMGVELTLA